MDAFAFSHPGKVENQQLFIFINGLFQGFHLFRDRETKAFPITRSAISSRSTLLSFVLPAAITPHSVGLSDDLRSLGLAFFSITFKST
jgi:hypothetical protein